MRRAAIIVGLGLSSFAIGGYAAAATVTMQQNQWAVFSGPTDFTVSPISKDGSFSYSYGFSDTGCGTSGSWSCMPTDLVLGDVQSSFAHNFGYGWSPVNVHGQAVDSVLSFSSAFLFFRVNSGTALLTWTDAVDAPAPVPLPAAGLMMLAGMGALVAVRRRGKV